MGSETRLQLKFASQCYMVFCFFLQSPQLNCAHSGMDGKISLPGCKENHFKSLPFGRAEASIY